LTTAAETPDAGARKGRRALVPVLAGMAVSALVLWLAVRGLRLEDVWGHVRAARPLPVLVCVVLATLTFPLRAFRWRLLLRDPGGTPIGLGPAWHAVAIGFMGNNILPLRAGELLRAYAAGRLAPVRTSSALASIAVERVFDALVVMGMLGVGLLTAGLATDVRLGGLPVASVARRVGILAAVAFLGAALVLARPVATERVIARVVPFPGLARRLVSLLEGIRQGLSALRSPGVLLGVLAWSLLIWSVNALSFLALFPAFGLEVDFAGALIVQGAIVFGIAVPSSPGYVGVFEGMIMVALALFGVPQDQAFAFAVTYHVTTYVPIILLGLYSLLRTPLGWRDVRQYGP
jgi:glycosyltransferase 2 family protein